MFDALPPAALATVAVVAAAAWQLAGTAVMLYLVPRALPDGWRVAVAAAIWLPISGAIAMALSLIHLAGRASLLVGTALVVAASLKNVRWMLRQPMSLENTKSWEKWLVRGALLAQLVFIFFATHPQRIYDQLNYHLIVGDLVVRDGQPFTGAWDPHAMFTGVVEWALAWHRSWTGSKLLFHGLAQIAVYFATVPALILAGLLLGRPSPVWFAILCLALPGVVPENSILRMDKPDGLVLTLVALALALLPRSTPAALALCFLAMACKLTAFHAALALGAAALATGFRRGGAFPLLLAGVAAFALQLTKNALVFGNPVYPALGSIFPSWATDAWSEEYWRGVAFQHLSRWTGWLGPFLLLWPGRVLAGLLVATLVFTRKKPQGLRHVLVFLAAFAITWPLFYGGYIQPRFVSAFSAGLLVLWWLLHENAPDRRAEIISVCLAITVCGFGWALMNIAKWNRHSAVDAYALQWPRIHTARTLNPMLDPNDTVVADAPEKFFFGAKLLFEEPLSPRERAVLEGLRTDPARTAALWRVKAVIVSADHPPSPRMQKIWDVLKDRGKVLEVPPDRVLFSDCFFCK
jgi:hypothetical protein